MDLRGAKSNVMSLIGSYRNRNCPRVALFGRMAIWVVWSSRRSLANWKGRGDFVDIVARAWNRFPNWRYALPLRPLPAPAHLRNRTHFSLRFEPASSPWKGDPL